MRESEHTKKDGISRRCIVFCVKMLAFTKKLSILILHLKLITKKGMV
jgi:hypothetical protein